MTSDVFQTVLTDVDLKSDRFLHILSFPKSRQVAQRATIAHLSPMCQHPFISNKPASKVIKNLNSFQIRNQLFFEGLVPPMSAV